MRLELMIKPAELPKLVGTIVDAARLAIETKQYTYVELTRENTLDIYQRKHDHPVAKNLDSLQYRLATLAPMGGIRDDCFLQLMDPIPWPVKELIWNAIRTHPRAIARQIKRSTL